MAQISHHSSRKGAQKISTRRTSRFDVAVEAYLAGRLGQAEKLFRQVIKKSPGQSDAFHLLGLIAMQNGDVAEAERRIRRAIQINPENVAYHSNLALVLRDRGDLDAAVAAFRSALSLDPDYATGLQNLGVTLIDLENFDDAESIFTRLLAVRPGDLEAEFGLANALLGQNKFADALPRYQAVLAAKPDHIEALCNSAAARRGMFDFARAIPLLEQAQSLAPDNPDIAVQRGNLFSESGNFSDAGNAYRDALERQPDHRAALLNLAGLARRDGNEAVSRRYCEKLLQLDPKDVAAMAEVSQLHEDFHRTEAALETARQLLSWDPDNEIGHRVIARLARRGVGDRALVIEELKSYLERHPQADVFLELGHLLDRSDRPGPAFEAFAAGNQLLAASAQAQRHDGAGYVDSVYRLRQYFEAANPTAWPTQTPEDGLSAPVFFVAFPRSGTTLMEQILDSHPSVTTTGEAPLLPSLIGKLNSFKAGRSYPAGLEDIAPNDVAALRRHYWQQAETLVGEVVPGQLLIDKLPLNLIHLGLVRRVFPDAKVLVALRDPRDVVLSCFMQTFELNAAMVNFLDLEAAARLYTAVMSLAKIYDQRLGLRMLFYRYEDLVGDLESTARCVFDHLELPWNDAVLRYRTHENSRAVSTPSYQDVTQPLYRRAVGRWRAYGKAFGNLTPILAPIVADLGYAPD